MSPNSNGSRSKNSVRSSAGFDVVLGSVGVCTLYELYLEGLRRLYGGDVAAVDDRCNPAVVGPDQGVDSGRNGNDGIIVEQAVEDALQCIGVDARSCGIVNENMGDVFGKRVQAESDGVLPSCPAFDPDVDVRSAVVGHGIPHYSGFARRRYHHDTEYIAAVGDTLERPCEHGFVGNGDELFELSPRHAFAAPRGHDHCIDVHNMFMGLKLFVSKVGGRFEAGELSEE